MPTKPSAIHAMEEFESNVRLPPALTLMGEADSLEVARQSCYQRSAAMPAEDTRLPIVPEVSIAPISPQSRSLGFPHTLPAPWSTYCYTCFHPPGEGGTNYHHPNQGVTLWDRPQHQFRPSPAPSSTSIETASLSSQSSLGSRPGTPLSPPNFEDEPSFRPASLMETMHPQPRQAVDPLPATPLTNPRSPFDYNHFAFKLPGGSGSTAFPSPLPSVNGRLPFALVPGPLLEAQPMSPRKSGDGAKSDQGSRPTRVDIQLTKRGTPYSRHRTDKLKLPNGREPKTRKGWRSEEIAVTMEAIARYTTENPGFDVPTSPQAEQQVAWPIIWEYITESVDVTEWKRSYDGLLVWTAKNLDRPTLRNPAPCDRPKSKAPKTSPNTTV
ncbi:hypothetical protein FRC01_000471 [Tulasnella sp. 417]|nr:hypothetical protein FRC01_000471 [Tulasnella sp. 417]